MSRHTGDDGKTPDLRITPDKFDDHCVEFAPPAKLIGSFKRNEIDWVRFVREYRAYLATDDMQLRLRELVTLAKSTDITLLCIEREPAECHRRLLAEICQGMDSELIVDIG